MNRVLAGLIAGSIALGSSMAMATSTQNIDRNRDRPWTEDNPTYAGGNPQKVTCTEFFKTGKAEKPFIVAYLEGTYHHHKEFTKEKFMPISVPAVEAACKANPQKTVHALIAKMVPTME